MEIIMLLIAGIHGWKFKNSKILNFQNSDLKSMPTNYSQFQV